MAFDGITTTHLIKELRDDIKVKGVVTVQEAMQAVFGGKNIR